MLTDCIIITALMMEAASSSEMSVSFYQTIQYNIPEDSNFILITGST
jgi:hypothetical protein